MNEQQDIFQIEIDTRTIKICDTREPIELRQKLLELGWQQRKLFYGDFAFQAHDYSKTIVTRKSTTDLLSSINEIFAHQLEMILDYNANGHNIILIEGSWQNIRPSTIIGGNGISYLTWSGIWNYLRRWQDKGFTLELTTGLSHTIKRLNELYALYQKSYSLSSMTHKFADDRVLSFPSGCRGKTAQQILDSGKSLADVAGMGIMELKTYDKIGDKKAELIVNHFNRRSNNDK